MTTRALSRLCGVNLVAINDALADLKKALTGRGIVLIENGNEVALAASRDAAGLIERLRKEELASELSKAALETLSIILYRRKTSRREIEYLRGVNCTSIVRTLLMRGLIQRATENEGSRGASFEPTVELLSLLGLTSAANLPEYEEVAKELEQMTIMQPV